MKYEKLLSEEEIEEILNLKLSFGERIKWFQQRYSIAEYQNNPKAKFVFYLVQGSGIIKL